MELAAILCRSVHGMRCPDYTFSQNLYFGFIIVCSILIFVGTFVSWLRVMGNTSSIIKKFFK